MEQSQPSLTTQTHTCGERSVGEVEKSVADQQESQKLRMRLEKVFDVPKKSDLTMQVCVHRVSQCGVMCKGWICGVGTRGCRCEGVLLRILALYR